MEPAEYDLMNAREGALWWYRALHVRILDTLAPVTGRVLDVGCGTGGLLRVLAAARPDLALAGIEPDAQAAQYAAAKSGAAVARGVIQHLPLADGSFDAVIAADVLCHAAVEPAAALASLGQVLRPGGLLVVNMPAYAWLLSAHDRHVHNARRTAASELRRLLTASGFQAAETRYWNGLLLPLMVVQRKLLSRGAGASDVGRSPAWLDAAFHTVTRLERRLPLRLPAGGSVLATARRPLEENDNVWAAQ